MSGLNKVVFDESLCEKLFEVVIPFFPLKKFRHTDKLPRTFLLDVEIWKEVTVKEAKKSNGCKIAGYKKLVYSSKKLVV